MLTCMRLSRIEHVLVRSTLRYGVRVRDVFCLSLSRLIAVNLGPVAACQAREAKTDWAPRRLTMDQRGMPLMFRGDFLACWSALGNALLRGCGSAESGMAGVVFCLFVSTFCCPLFACLISEGRLGTRVLGEAERN